MATRIGVDLGGTKIEIIAMNDRRETLLRRRVPTPVGDYAKTVEAIGELVQVAESELHVRATVGVGTPGAPSPETQAIKNANSTVLIGKPLQRDIEHRIGREIRMTNDANCFILSEALDGAAQDARVAFGVILGTGVGGGVSIDHTLVRGANAIAGEWGHNPLPWPKPGELPGPRCYCGKLGCIETWLSGAALARERSQTASEALALERYCDRLARSLATVINILDPDVVVFGGGVSNVSELYPELTLALPAYVFSDTVQTSVRRAAHGDSSGVRGAALLWESPSHESRGR
ncbi:MAG TPA: ROK family protein [Candidatus Baltobacteraceae bacterium]|jgi:fructokinase|nr:ROK family protein [Candidatus Baltobacteraceae bacterium]